MAQQQLVQRKNGNKTLLLPSEGDIILPVILSEAILLTDGDKITNPTISRQLRK